MEPRRGTRLRGDIENRASERTRRDVVMRGAALADDQSVTQVPVASTR
jgi:hypothetical protein